MSNTCVHGALARSCDLCMYAEIVDEQRAELAESKAEVERLKERVDTLAGRLQALAREVNR